MEYKWLNEFFNQYQDLWRREAQCEHLLFLKKGWKARWAKTGYASPYPKEIELRPPWTVRLIFASNSATYVTLQRKHKDGPIHPVIKESCQYLKEAGVWEELFEYNKKGFLEADLLTYDEIMSMKTYKEQYLK